MTGQLGEEKVRRDHVARPPLPWRPDERITECGRRADSVETVIEADQLEWRIRNWGRQRTAFTVCMTCSERARYSPKFDVDPVEVIAREGRRTGGAIYQRERANDHLHRELLAHELRAMVELVAEHRDEFLTRLAASQDRAAFARRRQAAQDAKRRP